MTFYLVDVRRGDMTFYLVDASRSSTTCYVVPNGATFYFRHRARRDSRYGRAAPYRQRDIGAGAPGIARDAAPSALQRQAVLILVENKNFTGDCIFPQAGGQCSAGSQGA